MFWLHFSDYLFTLTFFPSFFRQSVVKPVQHNSHLFIIIEKLDKVEIAVSKNTTYSYLNRKVTLNITIFNLLTWLLFLWWV